MANGRAKQVILLTEEDYQTLCTEGEITVGNVTIQYDVDNLHFTDYITSEMVDDSNSSKKFMTATQAALLAQLPSAIQTMNNKQDTLVSGTNIKTINNTSVLGSGNIDVQESLVNQTNIKSVNGGTLLGSGNMDIMGIKYWTEDPGADNTSGYMGIVVMQSEPSIKRAGYLYIITG